MYISLCYKYKVYRINTFDILFVKVCMKYGKFIIFFVCHLKLYSTYVE